MHAKLVREQDRKWIGRVITREKCDPCEKPWSNLTLNTRHWEIQRERQRERQTDRDRGRERQREKERETDRKRMGN